jgi:hypothetical protein
MRRRTAVRPVIPRPPERVRGHPRRGCSGIDRWFRKPINPEVLLIELKQNLNPQAVNR